MTKDQITQVIHAKAEQIAAELKTGKDVIIKTTRDGIKIQSIDYKKV